MVHLIDKRKRIKNTSYISPKFNFLQFCPVLPSFTQFYPVLPSFAQFYPVLNGFAEFFFQFHSIPPNFAQFYPVFPGFLQFCPVLPSFAQFCPVFSQFFQVFLPIFITSKISISSRARRKNNGTPAAIITLFFPALLLSRATSHPIERTVSEIQHLCSM